MIILMAGLPGVGKSTLAQTLARTTGAYLLDRDQIRDAIFPPEALDYTAAQNELASQVTLQVADYILSRQPDHWLILDGRPCSRREQLKTIKKTADRLGQTLKIILCQVADEIACSRLEKDRREGDPVEADRSFQKYLRIKQEFDPIELPHLILDTGQKPENLLPTVLAYLED